MLAENPQVLSLFEFFNGLDMTLRFGREPVQGKDFAALISQEHPFVTMVLSRGYEVSEILYPFDDPKSRYTRKEGLPWLLVAALSRLTRDPDALFDETVAFAAGLPRQPLVRHYRRLFDWLAERLGRELWIERSGSSIDYLGALHEFFPNARFLHLHRDGREAALSMREHHAFRLAVCLSFERLSDRVRSIAELGELDSGAAEGSDPIGEMLESCPAPEFFGRFWTQQIVRGFRALPRLDADQYLEVRFEDVLSEPAEVLRRISRFFELDPDRDGWIERAAGLIRGVPPRRFDELPADEGERLTEACLVGLQLLGRTSRRR